MHHGMIVETLDRAAGAVRLAPVRAELERPPLRPVAKVHSVRRRAEHQRARLEHVRQSAGIVLSLGRDLGEGDVLGLVSEATGTRRSSPARDRSRTRRPQPGGSAPLRDSAGRSPCGRCHHEPEPCLRREPLAPIAQAPQPVERHVLQPPSKSPSSDTKRVSDNRGQFDRLGRRSWTGARRTASITSSASPAPRPWRPRSTSSPTRSHEDRAGRGGWRSSRQTADQRPLPSRKVWALISGTGPFGVASRSGALAADTAGDAPSTATGSRFSGRDFVAGMRLPRPTLPAPTR